MDAPLVLSLRIDPNEIDKEAHNIDEVKARVPIWKHEAVGHRIADMAATVFAMDSIAKIASAMAVPVMKPTSLSLSPNSCLMGSIRVDTT